MVICNARFARAKEWRMRRGDRRHRTNRARRRRTRPRSVEKLKGDIAIASNSLKVFSQVLDGCIALRPPTPSTLANELVEQCRAMQPRLVELISNAPTRRC